MEQDRDLSSFVIERLSRSFVLGLAVGLGSCGWQAEHDDATIRWASRSPAKQPTAPQTYFGMEYEVQQSALRDALAEPAVQAF